MKMQFCFLTLFTVFLSPSFAIRKEIITARRVGPINPERAFNQLAHAVTGTSGNELNDAGMVLLLQTIARRFNTKDTKCFQEIHNSLKANEKYTSYNASTFMESAQKILNYLIEQNCSVALDMTTPKFGDAPICKIDVEKATKKMEAVYKASSSKTCFNQHTLLNEYCTRDNKEVVYKMLLHLYRGDCILPDNVALVENLFQLLGAEENFVPNQSYIKLLRGLRLGNLDGGNRRRSSNTHPRIEVVTERKTRHAQDSLSGIDNVHCYSPIQLRNIFGYTDNLTQVHIMSMCPTFLQQILIGNCTSEVAFLSKGTPFDESHEHSEYTTAMKYGYGTAAVTVITLLALVGILSFPAIGTTHYQLAMQFLMALGVGTLTGDAILHIFPDIVGLHNHGVAHEEEEGHGHEHVEEEESMEYMWKLVVVIGAIWVMFLFENILKVLSSKNRIADQFENSEADTVIGNRNAAFDGPEFYTKETEMQGGSVSVDEEEGHSVSNEGKIKTETANPNVGGTSFSTTMPNPNIPEDSNFQYPNEQLKREKFVLDEATTVRSVKTYWFGITSTGLMVFVGDVLHNFADGLAIGVAFSVSWTQGLGTTLAICFHELPHEFGDFAIYLNNGLSKWKALLFNLAAAGCNYIGLYVGLALSEDPGVRTWLLSFVAGMFLYISLVNVLHEMVNEETKKPVLQFILQNIGLFLGWLILFLLALYEEQLVESIGGGDDHGH